jgi:hypothetical protein
MSDQKIRSSIKTSVSRTPEVLKTQSSKAGPSSKRKELVCARNKGPTMVIPDAESCEIGAVRYKQTLNPCKGGVFVQAEIVSSSSDGYRCQIRNFRGLNRLVTK